MYAIFTRLHDVHESTDRFGFISSVTDGSAFKVCCQTITFLVEKNSDTLDKRWVSSRKELRITGPYAPARIGAGEQVRNRTKLKIFFQAIDRY